jgi:hypothetical protein
MPSGYLERASRRAPNQMTIFQLRKSLVFYVAGNGIALALFAYFSVKLDARVRLEERDSYNLGDALDFFFTGGPVFLVCLLLNVALGVQGLVSVWRRRDFSALITLAAVVAAWIMYVIFNGTLPHPADM